MSQNHLVSVLLLGLLTACSSVKLGGIGPHRIDVQQGNALDQESVAKLKPGLNRSQVRFLLGTPLLVDPFRNNRWDYVYTFYKGGKLVEQKRITLFFEDDILQRIEGDVPVGGPVSTESGTAPAAPPAKLAPSEAESIPLESVTRPEPVTASAPATTPRPATAMMEPTPATMAAVAAPAAKTLTEPKAVPPRSVIAAPLTNTSVVQPLSRPPSSPGALSPRPSTDLQLHPETNVAQVQPDVIPPFPEPAAQPAASGAESGVMQALKAWSDAWAQGNADAYLAAYAADFAPAGGDTHAEWEKRRRMLLALTKNIDLRIDAPKVKMAADGHALVTFNQYYRSKNYSDALVKQIKLAQREGRWLIVDEQVVSTLQAPKP